MIIGIDASRAFISQRTGIEEYAYQAIRHLIPPLQDKTVILYVRQNQKIDFALPKNWKIKIIKFPYLWTQIGLSLEMLLRPAGALFVPAHVVPFVHPRNTIATIHGLEYEFYPRSYSFWARVYMRWSIRMSCRFAKKIIAVSENTKKDLMRLYKVPEKKISVVYEGHNGCHSGLDPESNQENINSKPDFRLRGNNKYLLFIGRLEERKNIAGIIKAFGILKNKHKIPHKLVLAGRPGFGYKKIAAYLSNFSYKSEVILPGFVSEAEKWKLLKAADIFLFPTFYEGFGIPILEAQSAGVPVVAGDNSSIPEVTGCHRDAPPGHLYESAILVDPMNAEVIADAAHKLISDKSLRDDIIKRGYENAVRFSWEKCGKQIASLLQD